MPCLAGLAVGRAFFCATSCSAWCFLGGIRLPTLGALDVDLDFFLGTSGTLRFSGLNPCAMAEPSKKIGRNAQSDTKCAAPPLHIPRVMPLPFLAEVAEKYVPAESYATIFAGILAVGLIRSWAAGPSLLAREERLEATQRRARENGKKIRVTAGLNDMGARVVLIAVRVLLT